MEKTKIEGCFYKDGVPVEEGPVWAMSLKAAGSMRFRWNECNVNRESFLSEIACSDHKIAQIELIHSQKVYAVDDETVLKDVRGDGIITRNRCLIPVVTVADCMPIYIYDPVSHVFGMLHSGWKGTGIVAKALSLASEVYGSKAENFSIVLGPHIHDCCYRIDRERADYFAENFGPDCVTQDLHLSLVKANLYVLRNCGVLDGNIMVCRECTCCNDVFGSFRRETSLLPEGTSLEERQKHFTVQAAWVKW